MKEGLIVLYRAVGARFVHCTLKFQRQMAFLTAPLSLQRPSRRHMLPVRGTRRCPSRRVASPMMLEQNTIVAVATMLLGIGGGVGLVAWTEQQGVRTDKRQNVQACTECKGEKFTVCNICGGSKKDTLDESKTCSYCEGAGLIKCFNCAGSGIQPRFLDRLSPEDFMD